MHDPNALTPYAVDTRVVVYSFGQHLGVISGPGEHDGWVRVRLDDGRDWHGTVADVERATPERIANREEYRSELTPEGEQLVVPGCERNTARRRGQLDLF